MEKINFSGGEPFIHKKGEFLGELVRYCKVDLRLPSVTVVSNGSLITEEWFQKYGAFASGRVWSHGSHCNADCLLLNPWLMIPSSL